MKKKLITLTLLGAFVFGVSEVGFAKNFKHHWDHNPGRHVGHHKHGFHNHHDHDYHDDIRIYRSYEYDDDYYDHYRYDDDAEFEIEFDL